MGFRMAETLPAPMPAPRAAPGLQRQEEVEQEAATGEKVVRETVTATEEPVVVGAAVVEAAAAEEVAMEVVEEALPDVVLALRLNRRGRFMIHRRAI